MDIVLSLEEHWRRVSARGLVPIIEQESDIRQDHDGNWKLFCRFVKSSNDHWELDFFPSKSNPYLSPEIKQAERIPCKVHVGSGLYGLGVWLKVKLGIEAGMNTAIGCFVARCLVEDPRKRSYIVV